MSTLTLCNLSKVFDDGTVAVQGIDLDVADGEFVAIVGPSGCGKTTVLRMVAGLEHVSGGHILIDGEAVEHHSPQQRDIAMAFQQHALYPHMTVAENIGFPLRMAGLHRREIKRRVDELAKMLGLSDVLGATPRRLSGGQQQRVSMGRAIIRNPRLFLMDEPMSNLDAALRSTARIEIMKIQQRLTATTLYVTHDQVEAMSMADRVVVMRDGQVVQVGTPLDLYHRPVNVFVAQFIGSPPMSIVVGCVEAGKLSIGPYEIPMPPGASWSNHALQGRRVAVGLRPEALIRCADGPVLVSVELTEQLGATQLVHATIDCPGISAVGAETVNISDARARVQLYVAAEEHVSLWEPLRLAIDFRDAHFFDLESGRRFDQPTNNSGSHDGSRVGRPDVALMQPCTVTPVECTVSPTVTR